MQFQALNKEYINANPELSTARKEEILQKIQDLKAAVSFRNKTRLDGLEKLISASIEPPTLSEPIVTLKNQYLQNLHVYKRALKASNIPINQFVQQEKE